MSPCGWHHLLLRKNLYSAQYDITKSALAIGFKGIIKIINYGAMIMKQILHFWALLCHCFWSCQMMHLHMYRSFMCGPTTAVFYTHCGSHWGGYTSHDYINQSADAIQCKTLYLHRWSPWYNYSLQLHISYYVTTENNCTMGFKGIGNLYLSGIHKGET